MLRVAVLTLLCLAAIAAPAEAGERGRADEDGTRAAHQETATWAMQPATRGRAELTRMSRPAPRLGSAVQIEAAGSFRGEVIDRPTASVSLLSRGRVYQDPGAAPWRDQDRAGLTLAHTERLRVGLGYRHLEGEDLWPEFADTGAAGYDSHHILVRASWRF